RWEQCAWNDPPLSGCRRVRVQMQTTSRRGHRGLSPGQRGGDWYEQCAHRTLMHVSVRFTQEPAGSRACGPPRTSKPRPSARLCQPMLEGVHHERDSVADAELLEDVLQVRLHRALADRERGADFLVLLAGRDQTHDLE